MNLYGFEPQGELPDKKETELFLLDVDSVDLKEWRQNCRDEGFDNIPFICLSSEMGESRQLGAFQAGAEDILPRDFPPSLICQRIITLLRVIPEKKRKANRNSQSFILPVGNLIHLDLGSREMMKNGKSVHLTPREWDIFLLLLNRINRVVSRDSILDKIQGESVEGTDRLVDSHIKNLRKKLGDRKGIETERGYGYKLKGRLL